MCSSDLAVKMRADDLVAEQRGATEVRAQPRLPAVFRRKVPQAVAEREASGVADESEEFRAGLRGDGGFVHASRFARAGRVHARRTTCGGLRGNASCLQARAGRRFQIPRFARNSSTPPTV